MQSYDLVIVGGGIGGSALAQVMASAGRSVLLLEQSEVYQDRVRGEWIAPWGVDEVKRLGLYDLLRGAGGHHITHHVTYEFDGETREATARLIVGADGRTSQVRETAGIKLHQDTPHHWFAGLLIEGAPGWRDTLQAIGTEGDFGFLAFPQGGGRIRLYGGYALDEARRFKGEDGPRKFLDAFALSCSPENRHIVEGAPAGPLFAYINADSWTDQPFAPGVVLVGDAAGWNDPIIGLGLSITYRDVRIVSDILKASDDWSEKAFAPYAEERAERMRRLRFAGQIQSALDMEFGPEAKARRHRYHELGAADPTLRLHSVAVMAGPEMLPPEAFTEAHRARVLGTV